MRLKYSRNALPKVSKYATKVRKVPMKVPTKTRKYTQTPMKVPTKAMKVRKYTRKMPKVTVNIPRVPVFRSLSPQNPTELYFWVV